MVVLPSEPVARQGIHCVAGSSSTAVGLGNRAPTTRGRPIWPGRRAFVEQQQGFNERQQGLATVYKLVGFSV